jgi:hypothetical protein
MKNVYVLQHVHEHASGNEDVKFIGVYSTKAKAQRAVKRLGRKPGFLESRGGFHIGRFLLDEDHWAEGFADGSP